MIHRRAILRGLGSLLAAPAIVHAGNLMPIRGERLLTMRCLTDYPLRDHAAAILYGFICMRAEWMAKAIEKDVLAATHRGGLATYLVLDWDKVPEVVDPYPIA